MKRREKGTQTKPRTYFPPNAWKKIMLYKQVYENTRKSMDDEMSPLQYLYIMSHRMVNWDAVFKRYRQWMDDIRETTPREFYKEKYLFKMLWRGNVLKNRVDDYINLKKHHARYVIRALPYPGNTTIITFLINNFKEYYDRRNDQEWKKTVMSITLLFLAQLVPPSATNTHTPSVETVKRLIAHILRHYDRCSLQLNDNHEWNVANHTVYQGQVMAALDKLDVLYPRTPFTVYEIALDYLCTERFEFMEYVSGYRDQLSPSLLKEWIRRIVDHVVRKYPTYDTSLFLSRVFSFIVRHISRGSMDQTERDLIPYVGSIILKHHPHFSHATHLFDDLITLKNVPLITWFFDHFTTFDTRKVCIHLIRLNNGPLLTTFLKKYPVDLNKSFQLDGKKTTYLTIALDAKAHRSVKVLVTAGFDAYHIRSTPRTPRYRAGNSNTANSNINSNNNTNNKNNLNKLRVLPRTRTKAKIIQRILEKHPHAASRFVGW